MLSLSYDNMLKLYLYLEKYLIMTYNYLDSQKFYKIIKPENPYRHQFSSVCVE
jgi:hypothetical protein